MSDCKHFNGMQHDHCKAGVCYKDLAPKAFQRPCLDAMDSDVVCEWRQELTPEEEAAKNAAIDKMVNAILSGVSPCCGVPLDETQVIRHGRYKGHGPRFCSECGKFVMRV